MKFTEAFYQNLANLFYAISMADNSMTTDEKRSIVKRVEKHWANSNSSSELIYENLRVLIKEKVEADDAYEDFKNYYLAHKEEFSKETIHNLLAASHEISNATAGKNKSELIVLAKLYKLFKLV